MKGQGGTGAWRLRLIIPDAIRRGWLAQHLTQHPALQVSGDTADLDEVYGRQPLGYTADVILVDLLLPRTVQPEFWAVVHQLYPVSRLMALWTDAVPAAVLETALAAGAGWVGDWRETPEQLTRRVLSAARGEPPAWGGQLPAVQRAYGRWAQSRPGAQIVCLDPAGRALVISGRRLPLSRLHYRLVERLYQGNGQVVPSTELRHAGWPHVKVGSASLDQLKNAIYRLRQIIEPQPNQPRYLLAAPGGYRLCVTAPPVVS
ncbi:MAG: winged helix-turn-helix domain-containing protein [Anaerolineales bacterium]|nr:winged helix-turn-helix domain-containing protein [Anaerolineales bacterium]